MKTIFPSFCTGVDVITTPDNEEGEEETGFKLIKLQVSGGETDSVMEGIKLFLSTNLCSVFVVYMYVYTVNVFIK